MSKKYEKRIKKSKKHIHINDPHYTEMLSPKGLVRWKFKNEDLIKFENKVKSGHIQYNIKCLSCNLHFTIFSWYKDWINKVEESGGIYCPQCGDNDKFLIMAEKHIQKDIHQVCDEAITYIPRSGKLIIVNGIILDTPEKLVKHYEESEKINIKTMLKELKEKPLEVFFMCKGGFKYEEEDGYDRTWYDFMDKNGKVYTMIKRDVDRFKFEDHVKTFDNVEISVVNDAFRIKWEKN